PRRRHRHRRLPGGPGVRRRRPLPGAAVLHARLPGGARAAARPRGGPAALLPDRDVQRPDLRRAAAGVALPAEPRALPAGVRGPLRPAASRAAALEAAAGVVPAAVAGGGAAWPAPPRRRARGGDPADLVRLP